MSLMLGVSTSEPSRVVLHLLDCSSKKNTSSNEQGEHPFPSVQSHDFHTGSDVDIDDGDSDHSNLLVVQGPVDMQGTARQAVNYINHRINPKEQEPSMYFRSLPAAPQQLTDEGQDEDQSSLTTLVELVISTKYRDDIQVQVEDSHQMSLFLDVIPYIQAQTFYLRGGSNSTCLPSSIATGLDKVLSSHPTLKRLWLQAAPTTSASAEMDEDNQDDGMHYSIAASILKHPQSCIRNIMVEGYGSMTAPSIYDGRRDDISQHEDVVGAADMHKNMESFLQALETNSSVTTISFIKTNEALYGDHCHAHIAAMVLRLGEALCVNRSIETLYLGNLLEYLSYERIESFSRSIRRMKRLKVLDLRLVHRLVLPRPDLLFGNHMQISPRHHRRHHQSNEHSRRTSNDSNPGKWDNEGHQQQPYCLLQPIVNALEENCSLVKIPGWKKYSTTSSNPQDSKARQREKEEVESLEDAMNYQLQLNRSRAKQFVHEPTLPTTAWPFVLEQCHGNPTAMYYCLRYKVASVCA